MSVKYIGKLLISFACIFFISCVNKEQNKLIQQLDYTIEINNNSYKEIHALNFDSLKIIHDSIKYYNQILGQKNFSKRIKSNEFDIINEFILLENSLKAFIIFDYKKLINKLKFRRLQLENLKKDVINNYERIDNLEEYVKLEDSLMKILANEINENIISLKQHKRNFYRYHQDIEKLSKRH
ncbi:MAG: hypothetical protein GX879_03740 [Bacteroidales bacterium]|nr:hypothetical protein [Bacteroidales bacterium]